MLESYWLSALPCMLRHDYLFFSLIPIYIQKDQSQVWIRLSDIDDYIIVMCSWHCAQLQLRLRLLFYISKKKINAQKFIWSYNLRNVLQNGPEILQNIQAGGDLSFCLLSIDYYLKFPANICHQKTLSFLRHKETYINTK